MPVETSVAMAVFIAACRRLGPATKQELGLRWPGVKRVDGRQAVQ
jgi:hypothetical protein